MLGSVRWEETGAAILVSKESAIVSDYKSLQLNSVSGGFRNPSSAIRIVYDVLNDAELE